MKEKIESIRETALLGDRAIIDFFDNCISKAADNWACLFLVQDKFRHIQRSEQHLSKKGCLLSLASTSTADELHNNSVVSVELPLDIVLAPVIHSPVIKPLFESVSIEKKVGKRKGKAAAKGVKQAKKSVSQRIGKVDYSHM